MLCVIIEEHRGFGHDESSRVIDMIIARNTERTCTRSGRESSTEFGLFSNSRLLGGSLIPGISHLISGSSHLVPSHGLPDTKIRPDLLMCNNNSQIALFSTGDIEKRIESPAAGLSYVADHRK